MAYRCFSCETVIQSMDDERDLIEFDTEYVLAEVFPGRIDADDSWRKCSRCGVNSKALPASELTVIKHQASSAPAVC